MASYIRIRNPRVVRATQQKTNAEIHISLSARYSSRTNDHQGCLRGMGTKVGHDTEGEGSKQASSTANGK